MRVSTRRRKVYSDDLVEHGPERVSALPNMRRPDTAEIIPANGRGCATALRFMEQHRVEGTLRRIRRAAMDRPISTDAWTTRSTKAWGNDQDLATHTMELSYLRDGCAVLLCADASGEF